MKKIVLFVAAVLWGGLVHAASMNDYCVIPPFIQETIKPNLLLMFDNSASVFDLAHIDKGTSTRQSLYCYDQTYSNATAYEGYFKQDVYYSYNMTEKYFVEIPAITSLSAYTCDYSDTAKKNVCIRHNGATPQVVTEFRASGRFLNWLLASKFDIQKKALTGGKYQGGSLLAESRGCVGRGYVKEPLLANYVEGGTNTNLGVTLQVKGAPNVSNYSAPSPGGLTQFSIYKGNYNQGLCQAAVDAYTANANPADIKKAVDDCLTSFTGTATSSLETDQKVIFQQTVQECWQYAKMSDPKTVGTDAVNSVTGKCGNNNGVYDKRNAGPASVLPGDPDLLCGSNYAGYCFAGSAPNWNTWVSREYASSNACIIAMHNKFCAELNVVPVTDPTDSPSISSDYSNLPAMIADLGIAAQLGDALKLSNGDSVFYAKVLNPTAPSGLIQEFADKIRIGGMKFNEFGSASEAGIVSPVPVTKVCSITQAQQCGWDKDCPSGETCINAPTNQDGAHVFHYIGIGHCSVTTTTTCTTKAHCPGGELCVADTAGDHTAGFVKKIDDMRGATWTPFGEAYYNAIGYFAKDPSDATGKNSRTNLRLNTGDFLAGYNPSEYACQLNNVLLITDGVSTTDRHTSVKNLSDKNVAPGSSSQACSYFAGSTYLENLSWLARNRNISQIENNAVATATPTSKNQWIRTFVVFNGAGTGASGDCDAAVLLNKTAVNGGTNLYSANDPQVFMDSLRSAFSAVAGGSASGTAASILSNSEGSGANILQAVFYPLKEFVWKKSSTETIRTSVNWIGEMQNLWYYVDPYIGNSTVREDTDYPGSGNHILNIVSDYVVQFRFDSASNDTKALLYKDTNADGNGDTVVTNADDSRVDITAPGVIGADDIKSIWRAGRLLWERDVLLSPRTIYTHLHGATASGCSGSFSKSGLVNLVAFNWAEDANNSCILEKLLNATSQAEAQNIIKFVNGVESVTIGGVTSRNRTVNIGGTSKAWKLGDIISSTPRVQSSNKLQNYHLDPPAGYADVTYANDLTGQGFANSTAYKNRGMVYAGANDGMMHAFKLGKLDVSSSGSVKATLSGTDLGQEQWAFIPKNALPYLKFLAEPNYSHLYLIDGTTRVVDASIGLNLTSGDVYNSAGLCGISDSTDAVSVDNYWACKKDGSATANKSWRTVLVGSMGIGGASADLSSTCNSATECVKTPLENIGLSSYFALDITDPGNPSFMWEFTHNDLGFSTTGAAIARIAHKFVKDGVTYTDTNGRWLVVVGNGPTGPIDTTTHQFKGNSNKNLKAFVLDLRSGALLKEFSSTVGNAFAGSMSNAPMDTDRSKKLNSGFYSDDVLYFGYSNYDTASSKWDGGIVRLITNESIYPSNWELTRLLYGVGPVTNAIAKLQDRRYHNLWLYFGTGRYFYKDDDKSNPGRLVGMKEPCYSKNDDDFKVINVGDPAVSCKAEVAFNSSNFVDQTSSIQPPENVNGKFGWYIDMLGEDTTNKFGAERSITDAVALPNGAVFFTSFMPSTDVCNFGGKSFMWGVLYSSGGNVPSKALQGKALVQVSTGSFEEVNLATALTDQGGRKMGVPMVGKPPTDPPPIVSPSGNKPLKRVIHVLEK